MYEKIKSDIAQEYYQNTYPNDGQRFIAWYLRNIHNLDTIETRDCITDGPGDKQIDAIYIDNDSCKAYLIQGKFFGKETVDSEPLREILSAWVQIKNLPNLQDGANDKLRQKIAELATALEEDYDICFELTTTSSLTESAQKDAEAFQKELAENEILSANLSVVDNDVLKFKYDEALNKNRPYINHEFVLEDGKYMELMIGKTKAVICAIPLKDCLKIPGIKDGGLFRKNVRQSLGLSNKVNKGIAATIKGNADDFFFLHNGITAICSKLTISNNTLSVKELNVVNGCQSLSTIHSCSELVKKGENAYILFRFYEIENQERADKISTSTNSQSAVKARDLRSNDKYVLAMKKAYEQYYPDGHFETKRGEKSDPAKYNTAHIVNLTDLGKHLIAWQSQRPTISYSETRIFDKYFDQLFHRTYEPEKIQALNELFKAISEKWNPENPMDLNEALLAMKAYAPHHQLYAVSAIICEINKMNESVPNPAISLNALRNNNLLETVIMMAGTCLNNAFESASAEAAESNKMFVPQNWIKSKASLKDIRAAIRSNISALNIVQGGKETLKNLNKGLKMEKEDFDVRWSAD